MKKSKVLAAILSVVLVFSLTACGNGGKTQDTADKTKDGAEKEVTQQAATDTSAGQNGENSTYFKKYDKEINLTTHMVYPTTWKWAVEGDDANNNGQTRWLKSHMGINMSCAWNAPDGTTDSQRLELAFASNTLPDVIQGTPAQINKYAAAGKLVDIKALIEQYGSPLLKYMVSDAEEITQGALFKPYTYNGTAYALPIMSDTLAFWWLNYIRGDVVKELGMEVPASLSELEKVFEAYKAKYPDGIAVGFDNNLMDGRMQLVMSAYQAYPKSWTEKDGKLVYGSIQPEVKEGLAKLAEWYKKGYIDPEFVTKDTDRMYQDMAAGNVLSLWTAWSIIGGPFQDLWKNIEGSEMVPMQFLTDDSGNAGIATKAWFTTARAITTKCENPEAFVYILNEYLDSFYRNNTELRDKMKKEYNYDFKYPVTEIRKALNEEEAVQNGVEKLYDYPDELTGPGFWNDNSPHYSWWYGITGCIPSVENGVFGQVAQATKEGGEFEGMNASAKNTYEGWGAGPVGDKMLGTFAGIYDYFNPLQTNNKVFHVDAFSGAPTTTMVEKQTYLDKLELETFTRIIMGTESMDSFDQFVSDWNKNGGEQITAEVNEWYNSMK